MKTIAIWVGVSVSFLFSTCVVSAQGGLTPPGAPAPTMMTLAQIEPRTPISSLPFAITNAGSYYLTTNLTGSVGVIVAALNSVAIFGSTGGAGVGTRSLGEHLVLII